MTQSCWTLRADSGFLMAPDPVEDLTQVEVPLDDGVIEELLALARSLPNRIEEKTIRQDLLALKALDMTPVAEVQVKDEVVVSERSVPAAVGELYQAELF